MSSRFIYRHRPAAVLNVTGEDHAEFLQNQGTADLRGAPGLCRYSLWLDHRGRIQGDAFVLKLDADSMLLVSYATPALELLAKFDRHIIADDVEIEDLTPQYALLSTCAEGIRQALDQTGCGQPAEGGYSTLQGVYCFAGRRLGAGALDFLVPVAAEMDNGLAGMSREAAEAARIRAGIPLVPVDTGHGDDALNPMEAALTQAVSFAKGCYLGQEVVARAHRLQRGSRRLVRFTGGPVALPVPHSLEHEGNRVGEITSVVKNPDNPVALGWLKSRFADGKHTFSSIPFGVESVDPES